MWNWRRIADGKVLSRIHDVFDRCSRATRRSPILGHNVMDTFSLLWSLYGLACAGVGAGLFLTGQMGNLQALTIYSLAAAATAVILAWAQSRSNRKP